MENCFRYILIMDNKEFKKQLGDIIKSYDFKSAFGSWYKESDECIVVIRLQKSNYSNCYYLNIETFIQGAFGRKHSANRYLMKELYYGDVSQQITGSPIFDLSKDVSMSDEERIKKLKTTFSDFVVPFTEQVLSKVGIIKMFEEKRIYLTPAVRDELGIE